jgi:hypothetical protein
MESIMFQTLDEEIDKAEGGHPAMKTQVARFAGMAFVALLVFAGLYYLLMALE